MAERDMKLFGSVMTDELVLDIRAAQSIFISACAKHPHAILLLSIIAS